MRLKENVLFIVWSKHELMRQILSAEKVQFTYAYKGGNNIIISFLIALLLKFNIPLSRFWYNIKIKDKQGIIIVTDAMITDGFLQNLRDKNPDARIIFWYWNNVSTARLKPYDIRTPNIEIWSFNKQDCQKYNLRYNAQFYSRNFYESLNVKNISKPSYDLAFIGKDKGRIEIIKKFKEKNRFNVYSYFVANHCWEFAANKTYHIKKLSYAEMIQRIMDANAVLDIVGSPDCGITLRIFDGLYFGRKIVSNNPNICNYEIYNPEYIFILGQRENSELKDFLDHDAAYTPDNLYEYEFKQWLIRFG